MVCGLEVLIFSHNFQFQIGLTDGCLMVSFNQSLQALMRFDVSHIKNIPFFVPDADVFLFDWFCHSVIDNFDGNGWMEMMYDTTFGKFGDREYNFGFRTDIDIEKASQHSSDSRGNLFQVEENHIVNGRENRHFDISRQIDVWCQESIALIDFVYRKQEQFF